MIRDEVKSAFRDSLIKGRYNLLLGAGVSLDSLNHAGDVLPSAERLREELCAVTGAPTSTTLSRLAGLLDEPQRLRQLTQRFSGCQPGASLSLLPQYLWRRLFTFNIDDVVEALYDRSVDAKQKLTPLNFNSAFEPTPERSELLAIHLHGWVNEPEAGYVFSASEYVRVMSSMNPWMHLLSEILSTEPFVIAGTSLNEVDLEYYLSFRSERTPRRDRGPSILVQPSPDVVTEADCKRYGLELFPGTFGEFLEWVHADVPCPPTVRDLVVPDASTLFSMRPAPQDLVAFFSDFELVRAANLDLPATPSGYQYGREPSWADIDAHSDIERQDNALLLARVDAELADLGNGRKVIVISDDAGTGKTTAARRVAHDLVERGISVLSAHTTARLDPDVAARCLRNLASPVVVLVDGLADHVEQVVQVLDDPEIEKKVVLLGTERGYRKEYLNLVLGGKDGTFWRLKKPSKTEREQLLERYRKYGLVGTHKAMQRPDAFVSELSSDPMAVAVCRIMNDFKPLKEIIRSLWNAADEGARALYLCAALAEHCVKSGLRYSLLQGIAGPRQSIAGLFEPDLPLGLALNTIDDEYVVAANGVVGEQILLRTARRDAGAMMTAFEAIAGGLAPHVNRRAIMRRSPEARLAGRLFDCDKVVKPLLRGAAEDFYVAVQPQWEWNSRYWEQRALLAADTNLEAAVTYARHAVAIELHSYPLTTLGKVLLMEMEAVPAKRDEAYNEAVGHLANAIEREYKYYRVTIHPYATLLSGTAKFLECGGDLSPQQERMIGTYLAEARVRFGGDVQLDGLIERLDELM